MDHNNTNPKGETTSAEAMPQEESAADSAAEPIRLEKHTDMGNARRLVRRYGGGIRWVGPWSQWLVYDGMRWALDERERIMRFAKLTATKIRQEAKRHSDPDQLYKWANQSQSQHRLRAMVEVARSDHRVAILPARLDADPWLLNVQNGTVDLRTGGLRPHCADDLLSKLCNAEYHLGLESERWQTFLDDITNGSTELQSYLKRVAGCTLSGAENEKRLFVLWGEPDTGKTTFVSAIMHVLGDYALQAERSLLLERRNEAHPTGIADLFGRRLAVCSEPSAGQRFDSGLVKQLTGGDRLTARKMRQDFREFDPTHTIWLACNDIPQISPEDEAMWGRLGVIPFMHRVPEDEQNKHLVEELKEHRNAILTWAIEGCLEWQERGLDEPEELIRAKEEHRKLTDPVFRFLHETSALLSGSSAVEATVLFKRFQAWAIDEGLIPESQRVFGIRLTALGACRGRGPTGKTIYLGTGPLKDLNDSPLSNQVEPVDLVSEDPSEGSEEVGKEGDADA